MKTFAIVASLFCIAWPAWARTQDSKAKIGFVTTTDGAPIQDVLVIASDQSFGGWGETKEDGSFSLMHAGQFVSFRHPRFKPALVRVSSWSEPLRVQLEPADETMRLKSCAIRSNNSREWIGVLLRMRRAKKTRGPVHGEHDSHWYVKNGKDTLHVVDGYLWHAGLPPEQTLLESEHITVTGWTSDAMAILDLKGRTTNGTYWRWIGMPLAAAIEYRASSQSSAAYFDGLISASMCIRSQAAPQ